VFLLCWGYFQEELKNSDVIRSRRFQGMKYLIGLLLLATFAFLVVRTGIYETCENYSIDILRYLFIMDEPEMNSDRNKVSCFCKKDDAQELKDEYNLVIVETNGQVRVKMGGTFRQKASHVFSNCSEDAKKQGNRVAHAKSTVKRAHSNPVKLVSARFKGIH
jgi:hypothetical protein